MKSRDQHHTQTEGTEGIDGSVQKEELEMKKWECGNEEKGK